MTRASRGTGRVQQACLNVASVVGAVAILWFLLSLLLGWSLVLFKTGSMAPTYPTGAAAVAVPVTADEIEPGDVVTVPRAAGGLPVTHRVVSVADPGTDDGARELVLQGDDNATPDLEVYTVTEADKVVVGAPYVGYAVTLLAQPKTLAILTTVIAALTVWVFWPRAEDDAAEELEHDAGDGGATSSGAVEGGRTGASVPGEGAVSGSPAAHEMPSAAHGTSTAAPGGHAARTPALAGSRSGAGPGPGDVPGVGPGAGDSPVLTRAMLREGRRPPRPTHERST